MVKRGLAVFLMALAAGGAPATAEMTPKQFLQRFLADANAAFNPPAPAKPATSRAQVPLDEIPMPRLRPADPGNGALGFAADPKPEAAPTPPARAAPVATVASLPAEPTPPLKRPPPAAISLCGAVLADLGVVSTPLAPIEEKDCGVAAPVAVSALDDGRIDLSMKAIVDCHVAEQLAAWVKDKVAPLAAKAGGKLTGLRIAAAYACRTRDSIPGAKLSEHAFGDAIDISAFRIDDRWISVKDDWPDEGADGAFLAAVRQSACGPFTTVLGPGSDEFHSDHFHLDMIKRRTAGPSKGRYCH